MKNVAGNNGRVGVYGISYDGFLAIMAGIDPHPAVKAISPQAPMTDVWMGDDFFHNGAFRQSYGFDYVQQMEAQKTDVRVDIVRTGIRTPSTSSSRTPTSPARPRQRRCSDLPTAQAFLTQPAYTPFWQAMAVQRHLTSVAVPTLLVGGYWDQEDMWGTQAEYAALAAHDPRHQLFLVLGPWNHGGWQDRWPLASAPTAAPSTSASPPATEFRRNVEAPFFEKYLKDRPGFDPQ